MRSDPSRHIPSQRGDERIDFISARCPIACRLLLSEAAHLGTSEGSVLSLACRGLIGVKLLRLPNDARRTHDAEDTRGLLRANHGAMNVCAVRLVTTTKVRSRGKAASLFRRQTLVTHLPRWMTS